MQEKDLIRQLKAMREIKPRKDWVVLTKSQILDQESPERRVSFGFPAFNWKWALAPVLAVLFVAVFLAFNLSTPTDEIKVAEEPEKTPELTKPEKMAQTIKKTEEVMGTIGQLTEDIKATPELAEGAAEEVAKMEEEAVKLGQLLAVLQEQAEKDKEAGQELEKQVEYLISDLENRTLTEEQAVLLESAKAEAEAGNFNQALEKLLEI